MSLTQFSLENNRTAYVLLAVLLLSGFMAFKSMPRAYDPGFTIRAAQVVTYLPGASSGRVELLVTDKIEEVIQEMPELDFVKVNRVPGFPLLSSISRKVTPICVLYGIPCAVRWTA